MRREGNGEHKMQTELIIALTGAGLAVAAMIWIYFASFNSQFRKEKSKWDNAIDAMKIADEQIFRKEKTEWDKTADAINMERVKAFAQSQNIKSMTVKRVIEGLKVDE